MGKALFGMTMSLDGFVADRHGSASVLYPDLDELRNTEVLQEQIETTGAVVMGRRTYDMAKGDWTGYEFQVPIFVLTHHVPATPAQGLAFMFVTEGVESAMRQAHAAAGDKDVTVVGGPNTGQQLLRAGLLDEIQISIMPILLGEGLRLFDNLAPEEIHLEQVKVIESPTRTDIRYRVVKRKHPSA